MNKEIQEICNILSTINSSEKIKNLLETLFTESEIEDLKKRWIILKKLSKNEPQRSIAKELSVSLCKVTRGSKMLKDKDSIIRKILFDDRWQS